MSTPEIDSARVPREEPDDDDAALRGQCTRAPRARRAADEIEHDVDAAAAG